MQANADGDEKGVPMPLGKPGGLYDGVNISVEQANRLVILSLLILVVITCAVLKLGRGFTVTFDSKGGTDVESCTLMYGDLLPEIETPYREGYDFTGWYRDTDCSDLWDAGTDIVTESVTLYAGWQASAP